MKDAEKAWCVTLVPEWKGRKVEKKQYFKRFWLKNFSYLILKISSNRFKKIYKTQEVKVQDYHMEAYHDKTSEN